MKTTRKATPGEKNHRQPGWFIQDNIPTYRCPTCFDHMSLYEYAIDKNGMVTPNVVCPSCGAVHVDVKLTGFSNKLTKAKGEVRVK